MRHVIVTKNIFFCGAVEAITENLSIKHKFCIVDIESFLSLSELRACLIEQQMERTRNVILVGNGGILSKILYPLVTIRKKASLREFRYHLTSGNGFTLNCLLIHIDNCRNLRALTNREKIIACALRRSLNATTGARLANSSLKTFYTLTRLMSIKLHLESMFQLKQYLLAEFSIDELMKMQSISRRG